MKREQNAPVLSAVFVDYDNIYLSLKRRSEDAAKRFAKDAGVWLRAIENGQLITSTNGVIGDVKRRIVLNRCYGNPVPRRSQDGSTDMSSFPFVRHHFLRSGFEVVDCPPLTAQLKNSSDIRMVMDMRDYLTHDTYFDEFIILSGDADFTPVLHRLRQHARKTVIFANDHTAAPYTAICDGEVREADLFALLLSSASQPEGNEIAPPPSRASISPSPTPQAAGSAAAVAPAPSQPTALVRLEEIRSMIMTEVVNSIRTAMAPVPLEALADRALRAIGHERTIGSGWGGAGTFRDLLRQALPADIRLTGEPPYLAYDPARHLMPAPAPAPVEHRATEPRAQPVAVAQPDAGYPAAGTRQQQAPLRREPAFDRAPAMPSPAQRAALAQSMEALVQTEPAPASQLQPSPAVATPVAAAPASHAGARGPAARGGSARGGEPVSVQQSITRIYDACQAPPLAPFEYQALFEIIAKEITDNGLSGSQTLSSVGLAARERGIGVQPDDVRFVMDVISEPDPWFEQGASANLFASRFRNFVVQRCRAHGMTLSADELDLIDAWFTGVGAPLSRGRFAMEAEGHAAGGARQTAQAPRGEVVTAPAPEPQPVGTAALPPPEGRQAAGGRWWSLDEPRQPAAAGDGLATDASEDFPRIVRSRQRV